MKKVLFLVVMLALAASPLYADNWQPEPMVIDVQDTFQYAFDGSDVDIPFSLTGKGGMIYLIVDTQLADVDKPVAIKNGFRGWHFVNGIDTTLYVSSGRQYAVGSSLTFPWDGTGNERQYQNYQAGADVAPGTYTYTLWGFDNQSNREVANNFIACGDYYWPTCARFYNTDDTGAVLDQPLMMGNIFMRNNDSERLTTNLTAYKFSLGDDPYDESLISTTFCEGYQSDDIAEGMRQTFGPSFFKYDDYNTFYFVTHRYWELTSTVGKWTFVPGGVAQEDLSWGGFDKVDWYFHGSKTTSSEPSNLQGDEEYIYMNDCGHYPTTFQIDLIRAFPYDDPTDELFEVLLDEYYAANPPKDTQQQRFSGEANRFEKGNQRGTFYMNGDVTCLTTLVDAYKMLTDDADEPYATDGSGYSIWANSNGDWFTDKMPNEEPENPSALWACHQYEPRNPNNPRMASSPADMNGIMLDFLEFNGLYSCAAFTADGSGITYMQFADDSYSAGGDNQQKKGNGSTFDAGTIYDGIYMLKAVGDDNWGNAYAATCWIAMDSDKGTITSVVGVEADAPAAFSVAQNSPNPFNPSTTISFTLASDSQVTVDVYNVAGQKVDTLVNDFMTSGNHSVVWDSAGNAAGVYFYTVASGDFSKTMKMTLLK